MRVIGVVGPAGSGKSTVCRILSRREGVVHIDCDRLGWETYRPGGPAYLPILARFGEGILASDGTVDREKLGALVFSDPQAKRDLEEIVHPLVMDMVEQKLAEARKKEAKMALVEGALLLSSPHAKPELFDLFIWLSVNPEKRENRLRAAGLSEETIRRRFSAQEELVPPRFPNVIVVDGKGPPAEVARRVLSAITDYFGGAPTKL